jgi:hypothetical protein
MALTIYVEDQLHTRVRTLTDDPANTFLNLCRRLAKSGTAVLDVIDPYTDTMLNFIQLDRLIGELKAAVDGGGLATHEAAIAQMVMNAAVEARAMSGYLFFAGD